MQTSLEHLPLEKQKELEKVVEIVKNRTDIEKIILFGSFARGDWVSDRYMEGHITYEYQSDFDILVVVKSEKIEKNSGIWQVVEEDIKKDPSINTPVNLIVDNIHFVNKRLLEGNYFYTDIKKEGIVLFDAENFNLSEPKILSPRKEYQLATRDYDFWFGKAQSFLKDYKHNIDDEEWNNAAFHLHQVTEALFVAILLVFTGYRPKTHDLAKIENLILEQVPEFESPFPRKTYEDKRKFDLLKRAYVDARYKADYVITKEELEFLAGCIGALQDLTQSLCSERIKNITTSSGQ